MKYTITTSMYYEALLALANKYYKTVLKHEDVSKEDVEEALDIAKKLRSENEMMHSAFISRENRRYGDTLSTIRRLEAKAESMLSSIITKENEDFESMDKDELIKLVRKMKEERSKKEEENRVLILHAPEDDKENEEDSKK